MDRARIETARNTSRDLLALPKGCSSGMKAPEGITGKS